MSKRLIIFLSLCVILSTLVTGFLLRTSIFGNEDKIDSVMIVVEKEIWDDRNLQSKINTFADKISKNLEAKPLIYPVPQNTKPIQVIEKLKEISSGKKINGENLSILGTILIGEISLPMVRSNDNLFFSTFPFQNFKTKDFIYNPTDETFDLPKNTDSKINSFTTLIPGSKDIISKKLDDIITSNQILDQKDILISDFTSSFLLNEKRFIYENTLTHTLERLYYKYGRELLKESIKTIGDQESFENSSQNDILTLNMFSTLLPDISTIFGDFLGNIRKNFEGNKIWKDESITTPEYLIDINDKFAESIISESQEKIKEATKNYLKQYAKSIPIIVTADIGSNQNILVPKQNYKGKIFGKNTSEVEDISECSIYIGDEPTTSDPYSQLIEANYSYNFGDTDKFDECNESEDCCVKKTTFDEKNYPSNNVCRANEAKRQIRTLEGTRMISQTDIKYQNNLISKCNEARLFIENSSLNSLYAEDLSGDFNNIFNNPYNVVELDSQVIKYNDSLRTVSTPSRTLSPEPPNKYYFKKLNSFESLEEPTKDTFKTQIESKTPPFALPIHSTWRARFINYFNNEMVIPYFSWFENKKFTQEDSNEYISKYTNSINTNILEIQKSIFFLKWLETKNPDGNEFTKILAGTSQIDQIYLSEFGNLWRNYITNINLKYENIISYLKDENLIDNEIESIFEISPKETLKNTETQITIKNNSNLGQEAIYKTNIKIPKFLDENFFISLFTDEYRNTLYQMRLWHNLTLEDKYENIVTQNPSFSKLPSNKRKNIFIGNYLFPYEPVILPNSNFIRNTGEFDIDSITTTNENLENNFDDLPENHECKKYLNADGSADLIPPKWVLAISCWAKTLGYTKETSEKENETLNNIEDNLNNSIENITMTEQTNTTPPNIPIEIKENKIWNITKDINPNSDIYLFEKQSPIFQDIYNQNSFGNNLWQNTNTLLIAGSSQDNESSILGLNNGKVITTNEGKQILNFNLRKSENNVFVDISTKKNSRTLISFLMKKYFEKENIENFISNIQTSNKIISEKNEIFIKESFNETDILKISETEIISLKTPSSELKTEIIQNGSSDIIISISDENETILSFPISNSIFEISQITGEIQNYFNITHNGKSSLILKNLPKNIIKNKSGINSNIYKLSHLLGQEIPFGKAYTYVETDPSFIVYGDPSILFRSQNNTSSNFGDFVSNINIEINKFINLGDYILGLTLENTQYLIFYNNEKQKYETKEIKGGPFNIEKTTGINNSNNFKTPGIFTYKDDLKYFYIDTNSFEFKEEILNKELFPYFDTKINYLKSSDINKDSNDDIILLDNEYNLVLNFGPEFKKEIILDKLHIDLIEEKELVLNYYKEINENEKEDLEAYLDNSYKGFSKQNNEIISNISINKQNESIILTYNIPNTNDQFVGISISDEVYINNQPEISCKVQSCNFELIETNSNNIPYLLKTDSQIEIIFKTSLNISNPNIDTIDINEDGLIDILVKLEENKQIRFIQKENLNFEKQEITTNNEINVDEKIEEFENNLPELKYENEETKKSIFPDKDSDGIPDIIDLGFFKTFFTIKKVFAFTENDNLRIDVNFNDQAIVDKLSKTREKIESIISTKCKQVGGCLPIPFNIAFLVPGYQNIYSQGTVTPSPLPPSPPTVKGMPVIGFPGPLPGNAQVFCSGPSCEFGPPPSNFRFYLSPTLTGNIAMAMCFGNYTQNINNPSNSAFFGGQCFTQALPPSVIPGVSDICTSIEEGINNLENLANNASNELSESSGGTVAFSYSNSNQSNSTNDDRSEVNTIFKNGKKKSKNFVENTRPNEFPLLNSALWDIVENLINSVTDLPDLYIILPNFDQLKFKNKEKQKLSKVVSNKQISKIPFTDKDKLKEDKPTKIDDAFAYISTIPFINIEQKPIKLLLPDVDKSVLKNMLTELIQNYADLEACINDYQNKVNGVNQEQRNANSNSPKAQEKLNKIWNEVDSDIFKNQDNEEIPIVGSCPINSDKLFEIQFDVLEGLFKKIENYIDTISTWMRLLDQFDDIRYYFTDYAGKVIDNLNKILLAIDKYIVKNIEVLRIWKGLPNEIKEKMLSIKLLINIFEDFNTNCNNCKNERYSGSNWYFDIISNLTGMLIPDITFPTWPDVEIDLSAMADIKLDLIYPRLEIKTVPIKIPDLQPIMLNLPNFSTKISLDAVLPDLPMPPTLPELPDLQTIQFDLIKLPSLPPPPRIPDIGSSINSSLKIVKELMNFWCLLKTGVRLVPERELKNVIEFMTARDGFFPRLDLYINIPTKVFSSDKYVIRLQTSLDVDSLPVAKLGQTLYDQMKLFSKDFNNGVNIFSESLEVSYEEFIKDKLSKENSTLKDYISNTDENILDKTDTSPYLYDAISMLKNLKNDKDLISWENTREKTWSQVLPKTPNAIFTNNETTKNIINNINIPDNSIVWKNENENIIVNENELFKIKTPLLTKDLDQDGDDDLIFIRNNFIYILNGSSYNLGERKIPNFNPVIIN